MDKVEDAMQLLTKELPFIRHRLEWVESNHDILDKRLAAHWELPLGNISTWYIRIFQLPDKSFILDNTQTSEEGIRCSTPKDVSRMVEKWLNYHKERHRS